MPNVLAGPLLRRGTTESVTVWFALKRQATVTLSVFGPSSTRVFGGQRSTTAIGSNLHIVAVTARRATGENPLAEGKIYTYDAEFVYPAKITLPTAPAGRDASIAAATKASLTYTGFDKPSFYLPRRTSIACASSTARAASRAATAKTRWRSSAR
jgi:hypothetical protein